MKTSSIMLLIILLANLSLNSCKEPIWPDFTVPELRQPIAPSEISSMSVNEYGLECTVKEIEWGPEYSELISLDPQGEVIYPGSIIDFDGFESGDYRPIAGDRKPITLSISLSNLSGQISNTVDKPSLSSTRTAMQSILNTKSGSTSANVSWNDKEIYSSSHFKLDIGGNYGSLFADIEASFNYENKEIIGRYLLQFTQVYYSIDIDIPSPGIENFYNSAPNVKSKYSPVYVSSVKYGRKVYLLIESKSIGLNQGASLTASFNGFASSGGISVDQTLNTLFKEKSIKGIIVGGSALAAIGVINDVKALKDYLVSGANYSADNIGVPLSYNLRFVEDNSIAKLVLYDKFKIRDCKIVKCPNVVGTIGFDTPKEIKIGSGEIEAFGSAPSSNYALVGIGIGIYDSNVDILELIFKIVNSDGSLGGKKTVTVGRNPSGGKIEKKYETSGNNIISYIGMGVRDSNLNYLKIGYQSLSFNEPSCKYKFSPITYYEDGAFTNRELVYEISKDYYEDEAAIINGFGMGVQDSNVNGFKVKTVQILSK